MTADEVLAYIQARPDAIVARSFLEVLLEDVGISVTAVDIDEEARVCYIDGETPLGPMAASVDLVDSPDGTFWYHTHHDDGTVDVRYSENLRPASPA